jgi:predicted dehydrogenase
VDYLHQSLSFKLRKAFRYVRLYGPGRTAVKARSHYHMERRHDPLPKQKVGRQSSRHVGILGCGKFAYAQIAYYLSAKHGNVLRAAMDVDIHRAASLFERYRLDYYTADASRIIEDPQIDLVYVASNHASHAEYAIEALERGKHVHIEKPHVVSEDQLARLCRAMQASGGKVALGFNRPLSRIGLEIKRRLDAQRGPSMMNWFVAGHEIPPDHWYFRDEEGGRILGNLCHWTDFVLQLVPPDGRFPVTINPTRAEKADSDIAVTYVFGDGSIAAITFSAKGHTFEGVKERFAAHRGNALITMDDFRTLRVEVVERRHISRRPFRDHGHKAAILHSYALARPGTTPGADVAYVWETGQLFLKTKEALERRTPLTIEAFSPSDLAPAVPAAR